MAFFRKLLYGSGLSYNREELSEMATDYEYSGKFDDAIRCMKIIIKKDPKDSNAYGRIGNILLYRLKQPAESIEYFDKVIQLVPLSKWGWSHKGTALYLMGKNDEAIVCFEYYMDYECQQIGFQWEDICKMYISF